MKFHIDSTFPPHDEIFVFGSNLAGRHGAGAALAAFNFYGAEYYCGIGLVGLSYAIPTKDRKIETMSLNEIKFNVDFFKYFALHHPNMKFFVTRIGCGLAGYTDSDIAPLFIGITDNCNMPENWRKYL